MRPVRATACKVIENANERSELYNRLCKTQARQRKAANVADGMRWLPAAPAIYPDKSAFLDVERESKAGLLMEAFQQFKRRDNLSSCVRSGSTGTIWRNGRFRPCSSTLTKKKCPCVDYPGGATGLQPGSMTALSLLGDGEEGVKRSV